MSMEEDVPPNTAAPPPRYPDWLEKLLPEGPLKTAGDNYLNNLPDVRQQPLTPESLWDAPTDSWAQYAAAYFLLYPVLILLLVLLGGGAWLLVRTHLRRQELSRRRPCLICTTPVYPCAPFCPYCSAAQPHPVTLNSLGFSRPGRPAQLPTHPELLKSYRRCPRCASELPAYSTANCCPSCGGVLFKNIRSDKRYDRFIQRPFWPILLSLLLINFIPLVGSLLAISLYRRRLVAPYAHYLSRMEGGLFMMIPSLLRYLFSLIPFIGIIGIPLLALSENFLYRRLFLSRTSRQREKNRPPASE